MTTGGRPWTIDRERLLDAALITGLAFGYEQHIRPLVFPYGNVALIALFGIAILASSRGIALRPNGLAFGLFGFAVGWGLAMLLIRVALGSESAPGYGVKLMLQWCVVLLLLTLVTRERSDALLRCYVGVATVAAIVNLPIILRGSFLGWTAEGFRPSSWFHDANYAGAIFGGALLLLAVRDGRWSLGRGAAAAVLATSLAFTYSKGSMIALIVAGLWWFLRYRPIWFLSLVVPVGLAVAATVDTILEVLSSRFPLLRIEMGLNYRDLFWDRGLRGILDQPLLGHSPDGVLEIARAVGRQFSSIHNYYLETAFINGLPFVTAILGLIVVSIVRSASHAPAIGCLCVYLAVAANNFTFSIGGVGLLPFIFSIAVMYPFQHPGWTNTEQDA